MVDSVGTQKNTIQCSTITVATPSVPSTPTAHRTCFSLMYPPVLLQQPSRAQHGKRRPPLGSYSSITNRNNTAPEIVEMIAKAASILKFPLTSATGRPANSRSVAVVP